MFAKANGSTVGKHPDAIDAFIEEFSSMMFAKENELTVAQTL